VPTERERRRDEFIAKAEEVIEKFVTKKLADNTAEVVQVIGGKYKEFCDIEIALIEANEWISFAAGEDEELYENYKYRLFRDQNGGLMLAQGKEVEGLDPRRK
jgi:hypothetical protein